MMLIEKIKELKNAKNSNYYDLKYRFNYHYLDKDKEAREYIKKVFDVDKIYKYVDSYAKNLGLTT